MRLLAVDPGTSNLGWAVVDSETGEVLEAGVDCVWTRVEKGAIRAPVQHACVGWWKTHRHLFEEADKVLIELQYHTPGTVGAFPPMIVMDALFVLCELEFPGKVLHISPSHVKNHFQITGTYLERKAQVVQRAGLGGLSGRIHDIADCILICEYYLAQSAKRIAAAEAQKARLEKREALRFKVKAPVKPKVPNPPKPPKLLPPTRDLSPVRSPRKLRPRKSS